MSRCFPYPPPGYVSNGLSGEASVRDPIKLKRAREDTITELDNKKRKDKKERKEKKDKKKHDKDTKEIGYMVDAYRLSDKTILPKGKEEEAERSDLTEEHEQPACSQNFCHSPDSSGRGNKTKDDSGSITKTHGNILRIRLPLQRHREPESSLGAAGLCSNSIKAESVATVPRREKSHSVASSSEVHSEAVEVKDDSVADLKANQIACNETETAPSSSRSGKQQKLELQCQSLIEDWIPPALSVASSSEVHSEAVKVKDNSVADLKANQIACNETETAPSSSRSRKQQKVELKYQSLIEDWIPPALDLYQDTFDDSWLVESKGQEPGFKRLKPSHSDQPCSQSSSLWPCARYLPEADMFALPYTIPY